MDLFKINTRKVLIEKSLDLNKKGFYGMKFCSYKSSKESLLIIDFEPQVRGSVSVDEFGIVTQNYEPITVKIINSIDDNGSYEFLNWIKQFNNNKKNIKGIDMFFFKLNFEKYSPVMALRGCSISEIDFISGIPYISVNFFAHSFSTENS